MTRPLWLAAMIALAAPGAGCGFASTTVSPDGTFKQNQPSGQPVVWRVPAQSITYNFGGSVNATAARALRP